MTNINLFNNKHDETEAHDLYCVSDGLPWCIPPNGKMTVEEIIGKHGGIPLHHGPRAFEHNLNTEAAFHRLYDFHNQSTIKHFTCEVLSAEEFLLACKESIVTGGDSDRQKLWALFFFETARLKVYLQKLHIGEIDWLVVTFSGVQSLNVMEYVLEKTDTNLALANTSWEVAYVY